jgi:hypothetical protein
LNERAEIRDAERPCEVPFNMVTHFARLPGEQAPSTFSCPSRDFGIDLLTQQRGCSKYRAVYCLLAIKLTSSRIEQRDYVVHPFVWGF